MPPIQFLLLKVSEVFYGAVLPISDVVYIFSYIYIIWSLFVYDSMPSSLNEFGSRYISISNPLSSVDIARQRRRARFQDIVKQIWQITCYGHHFKSSWIFRLLVGIAWALTLVMASPQAIIWRVLKHPDIQPDFYQVSRDAKSDELCELSSCYFFPNLC